MYLEDVQNISRPQNKSFKQKIAEFYDEWLSNGIHEFTESGNIKPVKQRKVLDCILAAWKSIPKELIESSFNNCAVPIDDNGDEDNQISCFKTRTSCVEGYKILKEQMTIFSEQQNTANPFEITDSDVEESQFPGNILSDEEENDDVDID